MTCSPFRAAPLTRYSLAALAAVVMPLSAGIYENDFSSDPFSLALPANQRLTIFSNQAANSPNRPSWLATGGVSDSGYLKLTDAVATIRSSVVFPDFEPGFKVAGFKFGVDCRIGGGAATPADGFSINFARWDENVKDTVISTGTPYAGTNNDGHTEADRHEEGTTTGLGIGFDSYFSGGQDMIGISVRVDNQLIQQVAAPVLNGAVDNVNSLQTGPLITGTAAEKIAALGWARFEVDLNPETGLLNIWWKGTKVVTDLETNFQPSAGRLVFGARTGGQNQVHHFDNIELETFPVQQATVTSSRVGHDGVVVTISDFETSSVVTPDDITSFSVNGEDVTPQSVTKTNGVTTIVYVPPTPFPPRSLVFYTVEAQDQNDNLISSSANLTAPILPLSFFIQDAPTLNQWNIREIRGGTVAGSPPIDSSLAIATTPPGTPNNYVAP